MCALLKHYHQISAQSHPSDKECLTLDGHNLSSRERHFIVKLTLFSCVEYLQTERRATCNRALAKSKLLLITAGGSSTPKTANL